MLPLQALNNSKLIINIKLINNGQHHTTAGRLTHAAAAGTKS
jgi:hypothetical protein